MSQDSEPVIYFQPPNPSDTLETLEHLLSELQSSPDNTPHKRALIEITQEFLPRRLRQENRLH
jgi:hypothetical protein